MTLLVVDPDDATASTLTNTLSQLGFVVSRITVARELEAYLAHTRPELILCPYEGEGPRPLGITESVLAVDPSLPVAVVAPNGIDKRSVIEALRCGVVDVFESDELTAGLSQRIDKAVGRGSRLVRVAAATSEDATTRAQLREFQRDQRAGRYIQMGMLPPSPMAIDRYRLRHKLYPSLMLSGDFVDYFRITERHFAFYMADVSGHGASPHS